MTDHSEGLWFPDEAWATIASFLDNEDLARFRQLCSATQFVGSDVFIMQPLYNRLYALDKTLTPLLPQEDTLTAFKQAFEKIQARQQFEITYLIRNHPAVMAKPEYVQVLQECTAMSLKALEAKSALLDEINIEIIKARIDVNQTTLDLNDIHITRLPVALFKAEGYVHFWQNLTHLYCDNNPLTSLDVQELAALQGLDCDNNQLTKLDVQGLVALKKLWCQSNQLTSLDVQELVALQAFACNDNQLTTLKVQGLVALQVLWCYNNQLTSLNLQGLVALKMLDCWQNQLASLNVQGLAALEWLSCDNNPLKTLILTGVPANTKNKYTELERRLLFKKLSQANSVEAKQAIIRRLGADYTYKNCLKYCPTYAAKLFASDSANGVYNLASSALSQASAFLPSFGENPLKRKRDEDEVDEEKPAAKKRKRK